MALPMSVGVDVSKAKLDVAVRSPDGTVTLATFGNDQDEVGRLATWLKRQGVTGATPCVLESTGDYHLLSATTLTRAGFTVNVINPLITKRYQRGSIRDAKTDSLDAARLADIGRKEPGLRPFSPEKTEIEGRKVLSFLSTIERLHQQLSMSVRRLQETATCLELTIETADARDALESLEGQRDTLRSRLSDAAPDDLMAFALTTPGVSLPQIASLFAGLTGKSFATKDQLVAYVGLDVRARRSGTWRGREKISKRGNAYLRKVLYQIAWGLTRHHPVYRDYYAQMRVRGKHHQTCLMAVARKFLRFFFAVYLKPTTTAPTA